MKNDLEHILLDDARVTIPDDGFTRRVTTALPAHAASRRSWLTPVLVLGSTALGSVLAVAFAPHGLSIAQGFVDLAGLRGLTPAALAALGMGLALLLPALVLALEDD